MNGFCLGYPVWRVIWGYTEWSHLMVLVAADNWCCRGCISFECYTCRSRVGSCIFLERHQVCLCVALALLSLISSSYVIVFLLEAKLIVFSPLNLQWTNCYFCSNFSELFDTDWFITFLRNDVSVVKYLPNLEGKFVAPYTLRVPRKCTPKCYEDRVLPMLVRKRVSLI